MSVTVRFQLPPNGADADVQICLSAQLSTHYLCLQYQIFQLVFMLKYQIFDMFCLDLFPRLIRISNIKRRHIPFLSRKGQRVLQPAFSSVDGKIITIIIVNITITITAIFINIIITITITAITIINITKTMIFNIIRKSERAASSTAWWAAQPSFRNAMHPNIFQPRMDQFYFAFFEK